MPMSVISLTITLVICYLLIIKIVAYFAHRKSSQTVEDFFIDGRNTGLIALIGTLLATRVNALSFTSTPAFIYRGGILYSMVFVGITASFFLLRYFGPRVWHTCKKNNFITQAELFGHYYQSPLLYLLTVIIGIFCVFPFLTVQFTAVAKVFSTATENAVTYEQSVFFLALFTGIYIFFGGAKAVIWTDVVQGLCFAALSIISACLFTHWVGGYGKGIETLTQVIPEKLVFNSKNTPIFFDLLLSWPFASLLWPQAFQRIMMARSSNTIRQAALGRLGVSLCMIIVTLTMGIMATAALYGQISDSDKLITEMYVKYMPLGGAMIVLAVLSSGMSTIDSILLSLSSIFTRDIFEKLLPKPLSEKLRYRFAQLISVFTLVIASSLALSEVGKGYLVNLVTLSATFATFLLWPLLGMYVWKKSTKIGVISAIILSFFAFCITNLIKNYGMLSIPLGSTTIAFLVGLFSFVVVSLLTRNLVEVVDRE